MKNGKFSPQFLSALNVRQLSELALKIILINQRNRNRNRNRKSTWNIEMIADLAICETTFQIDFSANEYKRSINLQVTVTVSSPGWPRGAGVHWDLFYHPSVLSNQNWKSFHWELSKSLPFHKSSWRRLSNLSRWYP